MPHLAPLYWVLMPLAITTAIYFQIIMVHFHQPSMFPKIPTHKFLISSWKWYA